MTSKPRHKDSKTKEELAQEEVERSTMLSVEIMVANLREVRGLDSVIATWASSITSILEMLQMIEDGIPVFEASDNIPDSIYTTLGLPANIADMEDTRRRILVKDVRDKMSQAILVGAISVGSFVNDTQDTNPTTGYQDSLEEYGGRVSDIMSDMLRRKGYT